MAIEPNPRTIGQLRENIEASGADRIVVQNIACSDSEKTLALFSGSHVNLGTSSLSLQNVQAQGVQSPESYSVRARPLDDVVEELGLTRVDLIKVDVEGAEMLVFQGSKHTITRYRPALVTEMRDDLLRNMNSSKAHLIEFLVSLGYEQGRGAGGNREWLPVSRALDGWFENGVEQ